MSNNRRVIRIFDCWQSDDKKTRNFIKKALEKVEKEINSNEELTFAVNVDRDTQNITGSVDIQKVILNKIDNCEIFICDISTVGRNSTNGDSIINNNVAFELGYACGSRKVTGNILLANSDTTDSKDLPFDIRNLRVKFFSRENDTAESLSGSIIEIIKAYVDEVSGDLYKSEEEDLINSIQKGLAPRSKADIVIKKLYSSYVDLYPRQLNKMEQLHDALLKTAPVTSKIFQILIQAIDYEQFGVVESIYNNLELIFEKCGPEPNGYYEAQLEYATIICSDIILLIVGILAERGKWKTIVKIRDEFMPIKCFVTWPDVSLDNISELRSPRHIMDHINRAANDRYRSPLSVLEKEMHGEDNELLKYLVIGDLLYYFTNNGEWYYPQLLGVATANNSTLMPKFLYKFQDRKGFDAIKETMKYNSYTQSRDFVWKRVNHLDSQYYFHNPLEEAFNEIGIKAKDDLWKKGQPSIGGVL